MKKLIILTLLSIVFSACSSAETNNAANKNVNTNYNQNTAFQQIRNQVQKPAENHQKDINALQKEIEQGVSNTANSSNRNTAKNSLHESQHAPETR